MPAMTKFAHSHRRPLPYRGTKFGPEYEESSSAPSSIRTASSGTSWSATALPSALGDEDFLTSTDPDFHPTDVAEDAGRQPGWS
jgi:hypothetical protein